MNKPNQTKRQKLYLLILLILFNFNGIGQTIIPSTNNPSHITSNTTWSDPVYYIYDDIVIDGHTLTIEDGVTLIFGSDYYPDPIGNIKRGYDNKTGIFVENNGAIIVNGALNSMVTMTALDDDYGWEGISIIGGNSTHPLFNQASLINYCIIEKVVKECNPVQSCLFGINHIHGTIFLDNFNNIVIENSIITNNIASFGGGIMIQNGSNALITTDYPKILNNQIYDNTSLRGGAIFIIDGNQKPLIQGNEMYDNTAIWDGGSIAVVRNASCNIQENNIYQNTAECQGISTAPNQTGGGGILIGKNSSAEIIGNNINNNSALFNPSAIDETGLGGAILVRHYVNAIINENQITDNQAENGGGIAVYTMQSSSIVVSNISAEGNTIRGNIAYNNGGGVVFNHSFGELWHNDIHDNYAENGGGIYVFASRINANVPNNSIDVYHNKIFGNSSLYGSGIFAMGEALFSTEISIVNNLIYSNGSHYDGAGIYFNGGWLDAYINNNTITKNNCYSNPNGNAFYNIDIITQSNFSITNNIMFFNDGGCQIHQHIINPGEYNSNDIMDLGCIPEINDGENYDIDPEFVDFDNNQFSLSPSSQLIDLGNSSVTPIDQYDIAGNTRIFGDQIDIGAYEFQNSYLKISKKVEGTIYPNPASKQITIKSDIINGNSIIEIYSANAKLLIKQKSYQNNRAIIEVDKLPSGLYFIKVISENEVFTDKFIKN